MEWEAFGASSFRASIAGFWVKLDKNTLGIFDSDDNMLDNLVEGASIGMAYFDVSDLYDMVRRQSIGADKKLEELKKLLGDDEPAPQPPQSGDDDLPF